MEELKRSQDADTINSIIARYSEQARDNGKIFTIFILFMSIITKCTVSFWLCQLYFILEYLYTISISSIYKSVLRKYFISIDDGYALKDGMNPNKVSRKIATYGSVQMIINAAILIVAIICLTI
jgi:hypothetical protein